jgi:hypothetical protein
MSGHNALNTLQKLRGKAIPKIGLQALFYTTAISSSDLPLKLKENLLEMSVDGSLKINM